MACPPHRGCMATLESAGMGWSVSYLVQCGTGHFCPSSNGEAWPRQLLPRHERMEHSFPNEQTQHFPNRENTLFILRPIVYFYFSRLIYKIMSLTTASLYIMFYSYSVHSQTGPTPPPAGSFSSSLYTLGLNSHMQPSPLLPTSLKISHSPHDPLPVL